MQAVTDIANMLMKSVVDSDSIRGDQDIPTAVQVMREELKAFLTDDPRYTDERALARDGRYGVAFSSLYATCVNRIIRERPE